MARKPLSSLLAGIWIANILVCLVVGGLYLWYSGFTFTAADPIGGSLPPLDVGTLDPAQIYTPKPSVTPIPGPTQRPTITLWPTPSPGPSFTPGGIPPANLTIIGYSLEKRPLEVYRFGAGPVRKLIVAGIHGGYEGNTIDLAGELIDYLDEHPERLPNNTSLYILRALNPDGFARGRSINGRANANNVDLNHNWPYNWQADWSRDGCFNQLILTGGSGPGSEPEVQALIQFIDFIKPAALISYHSAALGIFPGGKPDFPPSKKLAKAIAAVSDYPYPPINTHCDYTGNMTDWAANTRGIPSVDIELTDHVHSDFEQNLRVLQAFLDWEQ